MLMLLELILKLASRNRTTDHAQNTMTELMTSREAGGSTSQASHKATVTLLRVVWISGTELAFLALLLALAVLPLVLIAAGFLAAGDAVRLGWMLA
jgi:hypothetical protein